MVMTIYGIYGDKFRGLEKQEGKWVEIFIVEVGHAHPGFKAAKSKFRLTATGDTRIHIIDPLNDQLYFEFKGIHEIPHMNYKEKMFPIDTMGVVFKTEAHFDDPERPKMVFYIRDNIESEIICVSTRKHAYAFREGFQNRGGHGQVIVVLKMWRVCDYIPYFGPIEQWLETEGEISDFRFNPRLLEVEEFRQSVNNRGGCGQVIVVLKMWRVCDYIPYFGPIEQWLETEGEISDFRFNPRLPEVEEFRKSVNNSDPYVRKYGAIGPL